MLGRMEQPGHRETATREPRRGPGTLPLPAALAPLEGSAETVRGAGRRVLAGAEVAGRLALMMLEHPGLGPLYMRTAFLQGAATVTLAALGLAVGDGLTDVLSDRRLGSLDQVWALVGAIYAALLLAQWVVVALSREFHDALSREASLAVGLEPEDPPRVPRVRLDWKWLRAKVRRRWRALWVLMPGLVLAWTVTVVCFPVGALLNSVLSGAWVASWWVVWTAAKSARAWSEPALRPPWFLRGWDALTARVPFFRRPLRGFGRYWHNVSRTVWAPVSFTERMPLEFAGLSLVRLFGVLPLVKFFVRPLIPVAAGLLLERGTQAADSLRATVTPMPGASPWSPPPAR
ncbi:MAG: hypothetical protein L0Y66_08605 [Myxococcaceae bacterium]|nr:hypothetical protein [Myxococcaceae bacterium]MCI0670924.1 hypothetical protein [Myxococcaceae bacterium]